MWQRSWQRSLDQQSHERTVAEIAANTRSLGYAPCAVCGYRAVYYIERADLPSTFRCAQCRKVPGATHVEPIRDGSYDLTAELRYQGRVKMLLLEDEGRREREASFEGVMTPEEMALMRIAYDRGISAEEFALRLNGRDVATVGYAS